MLQLQCEKDPGLQSLFHILDHLRCNSLSTVFKFSIISMVGLCLTNTAWNTAQSPSRCFDTAGYLCCCCGVWIAGGGFHVITAVRFQMTGGNWRTSRSILKVSAHEYPCTGYVNPWLQNQKAIYWYTVALSTHDVGSVTFRSSCSQME